MVARDNPLAKLTVSFWRDNECLDAHVARDGTRAVGMAAALLDQYRPLQGGDRLIVTEDAGDDLPEPSRSSHYS